jgi:hypothetical protein
VLPLQADVGWIGAAGGGPAYLDEGLRRAGERLLEPQHTLATWNLLHMARMLNDAGGIPVQGNRRSEWDAGARAGVPNPEQRCGGRRRDRPPSASAHSPDELHSGGS